MKGPARVVLAIDPGSKKLGMALVRRGEQEEELSLLWRAIVPREEVGDRVAEARQIEPFNMVIMGNGTKSKEIVAEIRNRHPSLGILVVDEKETTLQARERYWEHNPRRGWRRFLPSSLQVPPEPFDDFVAVILAERVLLAD